MRTGQETLPRSDMKCKNLMTGFLQRTWMHHSTQRFSERDDGILTADSARAYVTSTTCLSSSIRGASSFSRLMMRPEDTQSRVPLHRPTTGQRVTTCGQEDGAELYSDWNQTLKPKTCSSWSCFPLNGIQKDWKLVTDTINSWGKCFLW